MVPAREYVVSWAGRMAAINRPFKTRHIVLFDVYIRIVRANGYAVEFTSPWSARVLS